MNADLAVNFLTCIAEHTSKNKRTFVSLGFDEVKEVIDFFVKEQYIRISEIDDKRIEPIVYCFITYKGLWALYLLNNNSINPCR